MVIALAAWLLIALLLAGVGVVVWLGVDSAVRGWQFFEQLRRDREQNR
jgi:hypothetical protein